MKLPDLDEFQDFPTVGPSGSHRLNINGQAAALECYLELDDDACVRWSSYNSALQTYQGALIDKDRYKNNFLNQDHAITGYSYTKIDAVLNLIVQNCIAMKEAKQATALEKEL